MKPRELIFSIIIALALGNLIIVSAEQDKKIIFSNWILLINSLIAAGIAIFVVIQEYKINEIDRSNILFAVGLSFWFFANIVWAYYELVLDIVSPVPSLADYFLFIAYGFLISRLIIVLKKIISKIDFRLILSISIINIIFLWYIFSITVDLSVLSSNRGVAMFIVTLLYPLLNAVLSSLALFILFGLRKETHHFIPWFCELIALLTIVLADSWFAIIVLTEYVEQIWISYLLLSSHYVIIAGGLFWYIKHMNQHTSSQYKSRFSSLVPLLQKNKKIILAVISSISIGILISVVSINNDLSPVLFSSFSSQQLDNVALADNIIVVGAIIPLTGSFSSSGIPIQLALQVAEKEVNEYFSKVNSSFKVKLAVADSKSNPVDSLNAIKKLHKLGAKIIVGPATSSAVMAAKDYADENNIILISYSSTSPHLSLPNDNLFRLVPDDKLQGQIIANKMWNEGIRTIIPFWRDDIYANELVKSMKFNFEKLGGKVDDGIKYEPHVGKFATSLHRINFLMWNQEILKLSSIVETYSKNHSLSSIGVYLVSYDEVTPILIQSNDHYVLEKIRWYGSDSSAQNHHIEKNIDAALFAKKTNFTNPMFSIDLDNKLLTHLIEEIEKLSHNHITTITYPALAYDAFWIAALSLEKNTKISSNNSNLTGLVLENVKSLNGVSGKIILNEAGDRISYNYDNWIIDEIDDHGHKSLKWVIDSN